MRRKRSTVGTIPELATIGPIGPPLPSGCNYGNSLKKRSFSTKNGHVQVFLIEI